MPGSGCDRRGRHLRSWPERVWGEWVESFGRHVGGYERIGFGLYAGGADVRAHGYAHVIAPSTSPTHKQSADAGTSVTATASAHQKSSPHATSSTTNTSSGTHNFTVPSIPGDNVVTAYGSYTKIGSAQVKVTMCAKQTGTAFSVGAVALVYNASGASKNIGATILTGPGNTTCVSSTFLLYTAHLKVHAFIGGSGGTIIKTGPVLTLY